MCLLKFMRGLLFLFVAPSVSVTERTDFEIGIVGTEFIADRDSQEHTGQTTGCRHGDADADTEMLRG